MSQKDIWMSQEDIWMSQNYIKMSHNNNLWKYLIKYETNELNSHVRDKWRMTSESLSQTVYTLFLISSLSVSKCLNSIFQFLISIFKCLIRISKCLISIFKYLRNISECLKSISRCLLIIFENILGIMTMLGITKGLPVSHYLSLYVRYFPYQPCLYPNVLTAYFNVSWAYWNVS